MKDPFDKGNTARLIRKRIEAIKLPKENKKRFC